MATTCIALLRAVNVGGANSLRMTDFVTLLRREGLEDVRTYIQSGNAVFRAGTSSPAALSRSISASLRRSHGLTAEVVVLRLAELKRAIASNPFPKADTQPKALHLVFLTTAPKKPNLGALEEARAGAEQYALKGKVFYFYAPDGAGKSKLFSRIERSLGVAATARNWRTCQKLLEMAQEVADGA